MRRYPHSVVPSYQPERASQFDPTRRADILPREDGSRALYARALALDATIYGLPAVLQYREMVRQAVDPGSPSFVGFDRFTHDRELAGPGYAAFKTPNADTLYSNAWLDLRDGPVLIETPDVPLRYYTLQFLDMYGNASNIGTRTFGSRAGRYWVTRLGWVGKLPEDGVPFRVATPFTWVLMRVFAQRENELCVARAIQDQVKIIRTTPRTPLAWQPPLDAHGASGAMRFFRELDHVLRITGVPEQEEALVYRFQSINIGTAEPFDERRLDDQVRAGLEDGHAEAMRVIAASRSQLGQDTGSGWTKVDKARYGFNFLSRAVTNHVGLGANVEEENYSFNTFVDAQGATLDGAAASYTLEIVPPPVDAFWSLTLYDSSNFELYPNAIGRHLVSDRQLPALKNDTDRWTITIQHARPDTQSLWLPAPNGPFYLVFRAYLPRPEMISGGWRPFAVVRRPPWATPLSE